MRPSPPVVKGSDGGISVTIKIIDDYPDLIYNTGREMIRGKEKSL
jgi:hypothetical protein